MPCFQVVDGAGSKDSSDHYARKVVEFEAAMINITSRAAIADYYRRQPTLQETIDATLAAEHSLGAENGMYSWEEIASLAPNVHFVTLFQRVHAAGPPQGGQHHYCLPAGQRQLPSHRRAGRRDTTRRAARLLALAYTEPLHAIPLI